MSIVDGRDGPRLTGPYLGLVAGYVDAVDYLQYHAFGANMTGNTVLFALGLGMRHADAFAALRPIGAFFIGCMAARALVDRTSPPFVLLTETAVLVCAAIVSAFTPAAFLLTAAAMGMQNTAYSTFAGVRANTSFLTGNYDRLAQSVVELWGPRREQARATAAIVVPLIICYALGAFSGVVAIGRIAQPLWVAAILAGALFALLIVGSAVSRGQRAA